MSDAHTVKLMIDSPKVRLQFVKKVFRSFNINKDEKLQLSDVQPLTQELCKQVGLNPPNQKQVDSMSKACDTDNSGWLSVSQIDIFFCQLLKQIQRDALPTSYMTDEHPCVRALWAEVPKAPLDPILGMSQRFQADTDPRKVNVSIGAYRTDEGKPLVLNCVKKAEKIILENTTLNKEYLPQRGDGTFAKLCQEMLFGKDSQLLRDGLVATAQTLSGTGALRLGAEFVKRFAPSGTTVYISNPTWGTHNSIMDHAGVPFKPYRYWNAAGRDLDLAGMLADIEEAPDGSIMLLHSAAHNPTGVDPTKEQWDQILAVCQKKQHICWFDSAYQGFATGDLEVDAYAQRKFADSGVPILLSQSFAKNFGLYGERVGTFSVTCGSAGIVGNVMSQLDIIIRNLYSNPPKHGAEIVKTVLSDEKLYQEWKDELRAMSVRIQDMRKALFDELTALGTPGSWTHITSQIGMFSFTGLTKEQSTAMVDKHHVYMLSNGRISMAGVTSGNVKYLAAAMDDVVRNVV